MVDTKSIAEEQAKKQKEISVTEFFEKNRHLLGFDNKKKALLMTVKEAVDNSLDACEEAGILPEIIVELIDLGSEKIRVIVEDNGPGIVKKQIPNIFAKLLYGSKFHTLKQARGQQGIGISAAALYGQLTTGRPIRITSKIAPTEPANYCELLIDTRNNKPEIIKEEVKEWQKENGTRVELDIESSYQKGNQSVDEYLKQTSIVNPHVTIIYTNPKAEQLIFARAAEEMPKQAQAIKPHPYGVELGILQKMLKNTSSRNLKLFLTQEFSRVGDGTAKEICENAALLPDAKPSELSREATEKLIEGIKKTKIISPPTDCISPITEQLLERGMKKEIMAEFYCATSRPPEVYRGNPFVIECAVAYGGDLPADQRAIIFRYANRVPLLYQEGACAVTDAISETNWKAYGLQQSSNSIPVGPLVILVHMSSVWVPFTSESKEAIAHYQEIIKEIKLALQECGRKLSVYVRKKHNLQTETKKRSYIETYIPHVAQALQEIIGYSKADEDRVENYLREILEKHSGKLESIEMENLEYDEDFANIGKEEADDGNGENGESDVSESERSEDENSKKSRKSKKGEKQPEE